LLHQAADAVSGHEAGTSQPSAAIQSAIVAFETSFFSAQLSDSSAGSLTGAGARGGVANLAAQGFTPGSNDPFAPTTPSPGVPPTPPFTLFAAWEAGGASLTPAQASIGRGEKIFNTRPIALQIVNGLNDQVDARGKPRTLVIGTCGTCHNAPNVGSNTTGRLFDTGVSHGGNGSADLPLITLVNKSTGATQQSTDPGLALTTGLWSDVGKFKVPGLRNLSARAPYFHNGGPGSLDAVVNFYNTRFALNLSAQEHADLVNFLKAL